MVTRTGGRFPLALGVLQILALDIGTAYGTGMDALLEDPNVDAVIAVLMLTRETGIPENYDFIVKLAKRYRPR